MTTLTRVLYRMDHKRLGAAYQRVAGKICLYVLGITLTAGLWPFHAPANGVEWVRGGDGLEFGRHGSAVSSGAIPADDPFDASTTLEIWLQPARTKGNGTILSFDGSAHPGASFSLHQTGDALSIRRNNVDPQGIAWTAVFYLRGILHEEKPVFVTIGLDSPQTSVYVNGVLAHSFPNSRAWNDLTGRIVLANSPTINDSWAGNIFRLAIYRQRLTASEVAENYATWMTGRKPTQAAERSAVALYLFDERSGTDVHNKLDPATDLIIPDHYFVLHPGFMTVPWKEYRATWSYWLDVGVNVAGFIPFGFCVFAYLSLVRIIKHPGAATILLGFFTSLTIELLQAYLPTRSSGMTDLITNTLGTAIGVMIWRHLIARMLLASTSAAITKTSSAAASLKSSVLVSDLATSTRV